MSEFYFTKYEDRRPEPPTPYSPIREMIWQFLATMTLVVGGWYIVWRWTSSLNYDALWFAIPVALAETCAYFGLILFTINLWSTRDVERKPAPYLKKECERDEPDEKRPISVDVFFATYDEDEELVRLSILDAKKIRYPHDIDIRIHVLDDGRRESMRAVAMQESVNYISRSNNVGFKAGNLRNALEQTSGDFVVICDADTRPFPSILENTLGYFRDPDVAWVQTPQWFFDIPEGRRLHDVWRRHASVIGWAFAHLIQFFFGPITLGKDPFDNDPKMFYDVIQRRRNAYNASFCCGAGSIHRRDAVMEAALKAYANQVHNSVEDVAKMVPDEELRGALSGEMRRVHARDTEFTPYKFHVSEDIYTSIVLHGDKDRNWKSVYHPLVESKMLSPQDLQTWVVQRFKYAGGTLDIALHDNPIFSPGMSVGQRLMYAATFWSYFAGVWNIIFLAAPIIFMFTGVAPVSAYSAEFFVRILPFLALNELAMMVGTWGVENHRGKSYYIAFFPINLRALWTVLKNEKIKFPTTPKDRQDGTFLNLVRVQIALILMTATAIGYALWQWQSGGTYTELSAILANIFWGLNNIFALSIIVKAAVWKPHHDDAPIGDLELKEA